MNCKLLNSLVMHKIIEKNVSKIALLIPINFILSIILTLIVALLIKNPVVNIFITILLIFISIYIVFMIITIAYFMGIINRILVTWEIKLTHIVLKKFASKLMKDLINSEHKISINGGINRIINKIPNGGFPLSSVNFAKLLGASASIYPSEIISVWNATDKWYPPDTIFKKSGGEIKTTQGWEFYFKNLNKAYKNQSKHKSIRLFIVGDNFTIEKLINNEIWIYTINQQKDYKIQYIYFIKETTYNNCFHNKESDDEKPPKWGDLVLFRVNKILWFFSKSWAIGKYEKEGDVEFRDDKYIIKILMDRINELKDNYLIKGSYNSDNNNYDYETK